MSKQGIIEKPPQTGETEQVGSTALFSPVVPFYADEYVTIYHGDSREIMPHLNPFDLLLTDPPYGIGEGVKANKRATDGVKRPGGAPKFFKAQEWDNETVEDWVMFLARRLCKKQIIFGGNYYELPPSK